MIMRAFVRSFLIGSLLVVASQRAPLFAQGLLLTEFMADNAKTLLDEEKNPEDWVEIFNSGDTDVALEGYYLSDDAEKLTKWQFPAVTIGAHRFLIVFCSGRDLVDPALPLHTSFKLSNEAGEGIFLVAPDRRTIISRHNAYPEQQPDLSYGLATDSTFASPILNGAPARVLVPTGGDLGLQWTQLEFDDASWRLGTTAIGFGVRSPELELVGTDVGAEMLNVNSSIYIRIPFDVADPAVLDVMKLRVRYDDGFAAYVNGQLIASSSTAPPVLEWNSEAARSHVARTFEEFDVSSAVPHLKPGKNILAIQGLNTSATNNDIFILPQLDTIDVGPIQTDVRWYFTVPTPGEPNGPGFAEAAPRPAFSLASGVYVDTRSLELSTTLPGGEIRYTVDGTVPDAASTLYTTPISLTGPAQVTARVFKEGLAPGIPERNTFVILSPDLADFTSNLPLVICTTFGKPVGPNCGGGAYTPGHIIVITPGQDGRAGLVDAPHLSSGAGFRRRGSSTCGYDKFAFNIEMIDAEGRDKNTDVFDFPRESDYIMFGGNNFDRALMRNPIAYWMSREIGRWAARTRYVECYYHPGKGPVTKGSYFGIYAFMEKNKRNPERVDIAQISSRDNEEPEVTGGYLFRRDRIGEGEVAISGGGYSSLVCVYPKVPTREQQTYMSQFISRVVSSLNPDIGSQEDNALIDFTAWIDHHILCWYPKNVDAFRLSGYFYKDRGGPLVMGPVWDYDRTMGNADDDRARSPEGYNNEASGDGGTRYFEAGGLGSWYSFLFRNAPPTTDTPWNRAYKARWRELRKGPLRTENIVGQIDAWAAELQEAGPRNTTRWPSQRPRFGDLQGEIDHLKDWLSQRADWIDSQFIEAPRINPPGGIVQKGLQVTIEIDAQAAIYYTLDGTDPRGVGGEPSASALAYQGPVTINANTRLATRARFPDGLWSTLVEEKYVTDIPRLMITEIMYNPLPPTLIEDPQGLFSPLKMEFLELTNVGSDPVPLAGVSFTKGITFKFDDTIGALQPGQSVVIPRDKAAFAARYGADGILVAGAFTGSLTDLGEAISLKGSFDEIIFDFKYVGAWYPETNGGGYSLVNSDPLGPVETLGESTHWRASDAVNGSPGRAENLSSERIIPGDADRDGQLLVTDTIRLLHTLFSVLKEGPCGDGSIEIPGNKQTLDWDASGEVNVTDALVNLHYLFTGGVPHAAGTECIAIDGCDGVCPR